MEIIIGVGVNIIVQLIKKFAGTSPIATWATALALSLVGSGIYVALQGTQYWETALTVLGTAGAIYTFIITRVEAATEI